MNQGNICAKCQPLFKLWDCHRLAEWPVKSVFMWRRMLRYLVMPLVVALVASCTQEAVTSEKWVHLPGACFTAGELPRYAEEGPPTKMCVDDFEIATHEVTNGEFADFVRATGYLTRAERGWRADEAGGPGIELAPSSAVFVMPVSGQKRGADWWHLVEGASWRHPDGPDSDIVGKDDHPVRHVTRADAMAYAKWAGARLPTEEEWEYAARGVSGDALSPWAEEEYSAQTDRANTWQGVFPYINKNKDGYEGVAPVGSFPANAFGIHDMIGNVWEWTSSPFTPDRSVEKRQGIDSDPSDLPVGAIKGGSYLCADSYCARFRPAARQAQDLAFGTSHIGFRMARDISR